MSVPHVGSDWTVEWTTPTPNGNGYLDNFVLNRDQARDYGDELVMSLRVDGEMLQERGYILPSHLRGGLKTESC